MTTPKQGMGNKPSDHSFQALIITGGHHLLTASSVRLCWLAVFIAPQEYAASIACLVFVSAVFHWDMLEVQETDHG